MGEMNRRKLGSEKESQVCHYLEKQGMRIMERNFRNARGEIDIIGYHQDYLVFVEVKYRRNQEMGGALAAVDSRKMRQICKMADYYRFLHHVSDFSKIRYDVVAIQGGEIQWIQNAFPHIYTRNF